MRKRKIAIYLTTFLLATAGISLSLKKRSSCELTGYILQELENIESDDDFEISAHRGFSSLEIENTRNSISLAADKDYIDYIEIDARMTKDNKIVLSHNDTLLCNNSVYSISCLKYDEATSMKFRYNRCYFNTMLCTDTESKLIKKRIKNLNDKNFNLIGLLEGITCCGDKKVLLDLKFNNNKKEFTKELVKELEGIDISNIIFQSLDLESLKYFKKKTGYNCLALINNKEDFKYLEDFDNYGLKYTLINHDDIKKWLDEDKTIAIWTVDNNYDFECAANNLDDLYDDVIYITDNPDIIAVKLYERKKARN